MVCHVCQYKNWSICFVICKWTYLSSTKDTSTDLKTKQERLKNNIYLQNVIKPSNQRVNWSQDKKQALRWAVFTYFRKGTS
jgi:hypothetical protein